MSFAQTSADIEAVESAAATLDGFALDLRVCHVRGEDDWTGEESTKLEYDRLLKNRDELYALAERMKAPT